MSAMLTGAEFDPGEVEEAAGRPHVIIPRKRCGRRETLETFRHISRRTVYGRGFHNRDERLRPVTAHTMNQRDRKIYAPEIDKTP